MKAIKNNAKVNESAQDKLIRELREEIERLRTGGATVGDGSAREGGGGGGGGANNEELERKMRE